MATERLSEQLRLVMERQGALENDLMQERQARAEAKQGLSVTLGEVGGRADAAVATASAGASSTPVCVFQLHDGLHRHEPLGKARQVRQPGLVLKGLEVRHEGVRTSGAPGHPHAAGEGRRDERRCAERRLECLRAGPQRPALLFLVGALDEEPRGGQAAGEGEGLEAWRGLQEQWEPKSRSMLLGIYLERQVQGGRPEHFVKAGILINGLQEEPLRRHMVLHTSRLDTYEELRLEVTEIARAKVMTVNPVPMEVDASRFKGKGKGIPRTTRRRARRTRHGKSPDAKEMECYYCGKKSHKKSDCLRRKADLEKAKAKNEEKNEKYQKNETLDPKSHNNSVW